MSSRIIADAGMGRRVEGEALVAKDGFSARYDLDRARGVCSLPWGTELALAPFFGVMGVAPPPEFGTIASKEPRTWVSPA